MKEHDKKEKVLVALTTQPLKFSSIDDVLDGQVACSGSVGSAIRLANLLAKDPKLEVSFSTAIPSYSTRFPCIAHTSVKDKDYDCIIAHHSHWNGVELTFGRNAIPKTILWVKNPILPASVHVFFQEGGRHIVCPSVYHTNLYRALPQWPKKFSAIGNVYSHIFTPGVPQKEHAKPRLVFLGALRRSKGFVELTEIWSHLAQEGANIELALAGSVSIHLNADETEFGSLGLTDSELETTCLKPWLANLPESHKPLFLGALSPSQLRNELVNAWAAIVNPGLTAETFCIAAVDAQACNKTVFSIKLGGLNETIYQGCFNSLGAPGSPRSVANCILKGLANRDSVSENGQLAGDFVRKNFNPERIGQDWHTLIFNGRLDRSLPSSIASRRDVIYDLMRMTNTGVLVSKYRQKGNRRILENYRVMQEKR